METNILDYVHDYITVDADDARLLDTDFGKSQLQRLERLQHLGLVGKIHKLARHNKLEHAYGTYWLCKRTEEWASGLQLNTRAFRLAGMLHSIGHLPFSYAIEHGVLQLYHIHPSTKEWLDNIIRECVDFVGDPQLEDEATELIDNNNSYELYRWFSAIKIIRSGSLATELSKNIVRHLVDSRLFGYRLLEELDRLDYVLRDLLYLGRGRIEFVMQPFLSQFKRGPEDTLARPELFKVIQSAQDSLNTEVYMDGRVRCLVQIVNKAFVCEVLEGHITADQLFEMDDSDFEDARE